MSLVDGGVEDTFRCRILEGVRAGSLSDRLSDGVTESLFVTEVDDIKAPLWFMVRCSHTNLVFFPILLQSLGTPLFCAS